jgi:signal transduction histidine kinase/DNA-binding response OmpR family regulator
LNGLNEVKNTIFCQSPYACRQKSALFDFKNRFLPAHVKIYLFSAFIKSERKLILNPGRKKTINMGNEILSNKTRQSQTNNTSDLEKEIALLKAELKETRKELREATSNAENVLRIKSEFLASISHEIRTPLNAILGFSQWLHENTADKQHREYLTTILHSARDLLNLLNDILDLSKIESGKINIDIHPMNYQDVINDLKQVFLQKVEEKGIALKITTDSSVPGFIFMDELRFYQILYNMVSNAIKYTNAGHIHVLARAQKTEKEDEVNLIVTVEDTGIGIQENRQKYIFEIFNPQNQQSNIGYEGIGLGLAIVNGLLKKLNGTISIKSKPGKGSVFTLTFHQVKVDFNEITRVETVRDEANMKLAPCKIMIVDDISYNILVLKQLINSEDTTFVEAKDGTDALAKLKTEKPDLIFMDIRMPGINGFDATELIKQDKELKNIPVIAFTGSTLKDHNSRINNLFDGYLQKPVFKKDLQAVLKRFLKYSYATEEPEIKTTTAFQQKISADCLEVLPEVLEKTRNNFRHQWEELKDSLIIFEIESFNEALKKMAEHYGCNLITAYCRELSDGLKSIDIELIKRKLTEFPQLIENLEFHNQKMIR